MATVSSDYTDKNHVLSFKNKLLEFEINYNSVSSCYSLNCNVYAVNLVEKRLNKIENCVENADQFQYEEKAVILDCNLIAIGESQLQIPVILIGKQNKVSNRLKLLLVTVLAIENERFQLAYWSAPMKISFALNLDIKLTDGPIIFWLKNQILYINYLLTTTSRYVMMKVVLPDVVSPSILSLKHIYEQIVSETLIVTSLLIVRTQTSSYLTKITFKPYENSIKVESNLKLNQSAHDKYLCCARSVSFVHDVERFLCSTTNCELVEFDFNGSVTNISTCIGFTADRMVNYTGRSGSDRYVIAQSRSQSSIIDLNRFEVIKTYNDVTDVYIGGFGTSNRLLMFSRVEEKDLDECRIETADLDSDNITSKSVMEEVCIVPSLAAAKKALETRSKAGREAVNQNKSHLEHIVRVVNNVCDSLREFAIGHESRRKERPTQLFKLLNGETDNEIESTTISCGQTLIEDKCCEPLHLGRPWQRIVNERWVIGLEVVNLSKRHLWDLHLVLASKHELTHTANLFTMKKYSASLNKATAKPRRKKFKINHENDLPSDTENVLENSERVILTTSLDCGILKHEPELTINIVITFKREVNSRVRNVYVKCPSIVLSVDTLISNKFRTNFEEENDISELLCNFAAVQATTEVTKVTLASKHTDMYSLEETLKQSCDFSYIRHLSVFHWNKSEREVLREVFLDEIRVENKFRAHLITHTKNQSQFFALVQYLYSVFPEDILILPQTEDVPRSSIATSLLCEVNFIRDFFGKGNTVEEMDNGPGYSAPLQDVDGVRKAYEQQTDQNEDLKRLQTIDVSDYARFRKDLLLLETKTDKLIISESN